MTNDTLSNQPGAPAGGPGTEPAVKQHLWKYVLTVLITVLLTFALTAGIGVLLFIGYQRAQSAASDKAVSMTFADDEATREALKKLQTVYQQVDENFYKDLTDAELLDAMTRGLVDELGNRYTMYLTAEQNQQITDSLSGNYVGIGATVALNKDGLVEVTEVVAGSPAEKAGILAGDLFMEVNGQDVTAMNDVQSVAALVRGDEGTVVDLVMYRPSDSKNVDFSVTRSKINSVNVTSRMLDSTLGYVQIRDFSQGVANNFIDAVDSLQAQGARHIVFDLRNNTGGLASEVRAMLDYLLPEATIASLKGRKDGQEYSKTWESEKSCGVSEDMRYAILVNGMSASASELFSGCLRDNGKARLIGEQTFGKGSGTITIPLSDGSAINLANFLYYLPNGESIEEVGLTPDQIVTLPDETAGISIAQLTLEQDTQLKAAIEYLQDLD